MPKASDLVCLEQKRESCPSWSAPAELWWMLMCPNRISNFRLVPRHQHGVGFHSPTEIVARSIWWSLITLCICIRMRRRVPMAWNTSVACQVPKPGKALHPEVCARDRIIHVLDQVGKGYFSHLIRKKNLTQHQSTQP